PERAHEFVRQNYADYSVRFSGLPKGFIFAHAVTSAKGFSVARMYHGMAAKARTGSLEDALNILQLLSGYLKFDVGQETIRTTLTQPLLWRPSRLIHTELVALDSAMVADYVAGAGGIDRASLEFTGMEPVSPLMARHWQSVVRHATCDVLPNAVEP